MRHILTALSFLFLFSCTSSNVADRHIVASIAPIKWVVEQIADSLVSVEVLVPESTSAENFDPTAKQVAILSHSDIFFSTGLLSFEQALSDNVNSVANGLKVVELKDNVELIEEKFHHNHRHECSDPHIWLSVVNMRSIARRVYEELSLSYPDFESQFSERYQKLDKQLSDLHQIFSASFTGKEKVLIVHPSLSYMARDYNFEQIPVENEGKEPSASYIKEIIDVIKRDSITSIYYSVQDSPIIAKAIAAEADIDIVEFDPLATNWKDAINTLVDDICRRY